MRAENEPAKICKILQRCVKFAILAALASRMIRGSLELRVVRRGLVPRLLTRRAGLAPVAEAARVETKGARARQ